MGQYNMRQCEICDEWLQLVHVKEVVMVDETEWWVCTKCIAREGKNVVAILPKR